MDLGYQQNIEGMSLDKYCYYSII